MIDPADMAPINAGMMRLLGAIETLNVRLTAIEAELAVRRGTMEPATRRDPEVMTFVRNVKPNAPPHGEDTP